MAKRKDPKKSRKKSPKDAAKAAFAAREQEEKESDTIRVLRRELDVMRRKLTQMASGQTIIEAAVRESLEIPPDLYVSPKPPKDRRKRAPEIAVLHVSDTQIGKVTATYDSAIAAVRMMELADKTILITQMRRSTAVIEELHVYLGGDMIEGEEIFPGQAHTIDQGVFDQALYTAPAIFVRMIMRLKQHFRKIVVRTVPGNHGRNGGKYSGGSKKTNWDNVCYRVVGILLENVVKDGSIDYKQSESFYDVDYCFEWGNLLVHGDQIRGGFAGFPWYGAAKKAWGWIDTIQEKWDYLWFGHFHTFAMAVLNHRTFLANGTTESDNQYAAEQLAACGFPCQRLSFFGQKQGLIADHQIFLGDPRIPQKLR